ncbi:MAG: hypothetical protein LLF95_11265 [Bacteroidales bacterium]|nr:hypothetical protein [Bacteroidales bacterium]
MKKEDNIDCIFVSKGRTNGRAKNIATKHELFKNEIKLKIFDDRIEFEQPTDMYNGKTLKPTANKSGWFTFTILCEDIEYKRYNISEDSTGDRVIIYFN